MDDIETDRVADAILAAPGWARLGITEPDERLRRQSARELALTIRDELASAALVPAL